MSKKTVRPQKSRNAASSRPKASVRGRRLAPSAFNSRALGAIHSAASDLHAAGLISKRTLREFDAACIAPPKMTNTQIKSLRERLGVSQAVFAAHLGTTTSTVIQWESGSKRPSGMGLRLLDIANRKGLDALVFD